MNYSRKTVSSKHEDQEIIIIEDSYAYQKIRNYFVKENYLTALSSVNDFVNIFEINNQAIPETFTLKISFLCSLLFMKSNRIDTAKEIVSELKVEENLISIFLDILETSGFPDFDSFMTNYDQKIVMGLVDYEFGLIDKQFNLPVIEAVQETSRELREVEYIPCAAKAKEYFNKGNKLFAAVIYQYILAEYADVLDTRELDIYRGNYQLCFDRVLQ